MQVQAHLALMVWNLQEGPSLRTMDHTNSSGGLEEGLF